jgi:hypothetical protein
LAAGIKFAPIREIRVKKIRVSSVFNPWLKDPRQKQFEPSRFSRYNFPR